MPPLIWSISRSRMISDLYLKTYLFLILYIQTMNTQFNAQATELEEAVIGACLIEKRAIVLVADKLRPEMFYTTVHQTLFTVLVRMYQLSIPIDILTVKEELIKCNKLEEVGGPFIIAQLSSKVASSAHIELHAEIIRQKYIRRQMIVGFNKLYAQAMDETFDIADVMVDAHDMLDKLEGEFEYNNGMRSIDTLMLDTINEAKMRAAKSKDGLTGIPTGLTDLNHMTSGLQNGDLIIVAARPSVGKTAFAMHLTLAAAGAGFAVTVYSLEMQGERLGDRLLLSTTNLNPYCWRSGLISSENMAEAEQSAAELARRPIYVDDSSLVSMEHIRSSARMLKSRHACDLVIIDYLQLCDSSTGAFNRNREQEVAQMSRKAKLLAQELNIPVVLLSQLNRESENRPGGRPELSNLRESGAIEQDADVVMLLYRPALAHMATDRESGYPTEGLGVVIVAKQRNGEIGNVYFGHNKSMTKLGDYVPPLDYMKKNAK